MEGSFQDGEAGWQGGWNLWQGSGMGTGEGLGQGGRRLGNLCVILGAGFLLFLLVCNWLTFIGFVRHRRRHPESKRGHSFAPPFLAGLVGMVGCLLYPARWVQRLAWVPLVLDPSILLLVAILVMSFCRRLFFIGGRRKEE